jgi:hypothetical protein
MSQQPSDALGATAHVPSLLTELAGNASPVAEQAKKLGKTEEVRAELRNRLVQEVEWSSKDRRRQFEQAVVWRRWNISLGLTAGLLTAAAGSTALFAHAPAAIIGLLATFTTGALATLNAGQRKTQSQTAACGYQEIEAFANELLGELPYLPLATALQQADQTTARRLLLNQTAEPPSSRALYRVNRADRENGRYGRTLSFSERNPLVLWDRKPQSVD